MEKPVAATIEEHFGSITDPQIERTKRHKQIDILVIAICATICGCDNWEDIAAFGEAKQEWFATFLELPNGIRQIPGGTALNEDGQLFGWG